MWKYLILNMLWFFILTFVHFFGSKKDQITVFLSILFLSAFFLVKGLMDPYAWFYYLLFSFLVFFGAASFKRWSYSRLLVLGRQVGDVSVRLKASKKMLNEQRRSTQFLGQKADEIVAFYEQIREMSRSLDPYETFLIFSEALSGYFEFKEVKLSLFDETERRSQVPSEIFSLEGRIFKEVFDRARYLKDRKLGKGEFYPFDQNVLEKVFIDKKSFHSDLSESHPAVSAYPIFINDEIFGILTLIGADTKQDPLFFILIERFISELQRVRLYESVQKLAITDGLTGVYARHHLIGRLEEEIERSKRFNLKLSFLMIDIDYFKHFNDQYGHLIGDVVLKHVAQTIKKSIREVDFMGRYGGEEFGVALIETDEGTAFFVAERIRRAVQDKEFQAYEENLRVNVSIGSATLSAKINRAAALMDAADAALYQAKRQGRNRVNVAGAGFVD